MNWIPDTLQLSNNKVALIPLEECHFEELCNLGLDKSIWTFSPIGTDGSDRNQLSAFLSLSLRKKAAGEFFPFVIKSLPSGRITGSTLYHSISPTNKSLEIGCTWLPPEYWGTGINTACKYLMLEHCFEKLGAIRVQLKASEGNIRSRKAIEKIGGRFEGVLRKDKIL